MHRRALVGALAHFFTLPIVSMMILLNRYFAQGLTQGVLAAQPAIVAGAPFPGRGTWSSMPLFSAPVGERGCAPGRVPRPHALTNRECVVVIGRKRKR